MDMNVYLIEWWAKERLGEIRAAMAQEHLAESAEPRPSLRVALGLALVSIGRKLQGDRAAVSAAATEGSIAS
jgi:hypothetical protein